MYSIIVGNYYAFNIYKVIDAANQVYYIGSPQGHGITKIADTEEELKKELEKEASILNNWLAKIR